MTRQYRNTGATHTEGKIYAQMNAQADNAPDWHPDRKLKGTGHVVLLERAVAYCARDRGISQHQFKQSMGWM